MRILGRGATPTKIPTLAVRELLNKKTKTDVWALVGIVDHDYSDTTSDSLIHVIFDSKLCLSLRFWVVSGVNHVTASSCPLGRG